MSDRSLNVTALTRRAVEAAGAGNLEEARQILAEALQIDHNYEPAWLWYAHVAQNDAERKYCLLRAAEINDDSKANAALLKLGNVTAQEPAELQDVIDPEPPPTLLESATRSRRSGWWWWIGSAVVIAGVVLGLAWYLNRDTTSGAEPLYIAFASDTTGKSAKEVDIMLKSVQLEVARLNANGGVDGRPVEVLVFDDQGTEEGAVAAAEAIVADDRILAVIGHRASTQSLAASPIYERAKIPVISPASTADQVTIHNPWGFRTVFTNSSQGLMMAAAIEDVLHSDRVTVIQGSGSYAESVSAAVRLAFDGKINPVVHYPDEEAIPDVVTQVKMLDDPGTIVLATDAAVTAPLLVALRDKGVTAPIIGGNSIAQNTFLTGIAELPDLDHPPTFYTDGLLTVAPMFSDSLSGNALRWLNQFQAAYGFDPSWRGGTSHDATLALEHAMELANLDTLESQEERRSAIRDGLLSLDSPANAIAGVVGPIWFDERRGVPQRMVIGVAEDGLFRSAPQQFVPYRPTDARMSVEEELDTGQVISVSGSLLQKQRIVYTGVSVNSISELDLSDQTYRADFFVWFTYTGDPNATDVQFNNSVDARLTVGDPVRTVENGEEIYQLFRVNARFKAQLDFHAFPFDLQVLPIQFQNRTLPIDDLVYALDSTVVQLTQEERLRSDLDGSRTLNEIPNWQASKLEIYRGSVGSASSLGDPTAQSATQGIEYSTMTTDIVIGRDVRSFLIKNLLPLMLLTLVTYTSLYFSHSQTGARVTFGITGILTGSVLLSEVTRSMPDVGYTVAIEWAYYAFILLSAFCVLIGLLGDKYYEKRRFTSLEKMDVFARVVYPLVIVAVIAWYWWSYAA